MTPGFCFQPPTSTLQTKKTTFWRYTWSSGAPTNCWKSKNQWVIGVFQPHKWSYGPAFLAASILLRTTLPRSENLETCQVILLEDLPVKPTLWLMLKGFTVVSMKINKGSVVKYWWFMIRWLFSQSYQGLGKSQSILINGLVIHFRKIMAGTWKWGSGRWDSSVGSIIFKFPAVCLRGGVSKLGMRTS